MNNKEVIQTILQTTIDQLYTVKYGVMLICSGLDINTKFDELTDSDFELIMHNESGRMYGDLITSINNRYNHGELIHNFVELEMMCICGFEYQKTNITYHKYVIEKYGKYSNMMLLLYPAFIKLYNLLDDSCNISESFKNSNQMYLYVIRLVFELFVKR